MKNLRIAPNITWKNRVALGVILFLFPTFSKGQSCKPNYIKTNQSHCSNSPIHFLANSPGMSSFQWDFGDGNTTTSRDPVHSFSNPGNFIVTYKGSDAAGTCEDTFHIQIKESPTVSTALVSQKQQDFKGNQFCFVDNSLPAKNNKMVKITYSFSDGGTVTLTNPSGTNSLCYSVIDPKGGCFDLVIQAEDSTGCIGTLTIKSAICVNPQSGFVSDKKDKSNVYPNPVTDKVNIALDRPALIRIYSPVGQVLFAEHINAGNAVINWNEFPKGHYWLEVFDGAFYERQVLQKQ